jgi:CBS domain-containing protein
MRIADLYTPDVRSCDPASDLTLAGSILAETSCGALPVVDASARVVGIVTDRDLCLALTSRNVRASELTVGDVMTRTVQTCREEDDARYALRLMGDHKVHRLPVVNAEGRLRGIVSLDDLVLAVHEAGDTPGLNAREVMDVLGSICESYVRKKDAAVPPLGRAA